MRSAHIIKIQSLKLCFRQTVNFFNIRFSYQPKLSFALLRLQMPRNCSRLLKPGGITALHPTSARVLLYRHGGPWPVTMPLSAADTKCLRRKKHLTLIWTVIKSWHKSMKRRVVQERVPEKPAGSASDYEPVRAESGLSQHWTKTISERPQSGPVIPL